MKIAFFSYSAAGCDLAERIRWMCFPDEECRLFTITRLCTDSFEVVTDQSAADIFNSYDAMIFVCAAGIAIRKIAPFVKDKKTDPAVICIDEKGTFVIPLLSGHIGGANALAEKIAGLLGSTAAITTATDVNGKFAADEWAASNGYIISDMKMAKRVSAMILEHDIPVFSDFPVSGGYPSGIFPAETAGRPEKSNSGLKTDDRISDTGIYIGYRKYKPFPYTLQIIPRIVSLGIGCRKGTAGSSIKLAVRKIAELNSIDIRSIKGVYSIDIKAEEPGIVEFCSCMGLPFETYSAQQLMNVKGTFESSDFVKSVTGADNVCERAAACGGGSIIVQKKVFGAVTAALAADDIVISFRSRL